MLEVYEFLSVFYEVSLHSFVGWGKVSSLKITKERVVKDLLCMLFVKTNSVYQIAEIFDILEWLRKSEFCNFLKTSIANCFKNIFVSFAKKYLDYYDLSGTTEYLWGELTQWGVIELDTFSQQIVCVPDFPNHYITTGGLPFCPPPPLSIT